MTRLDMLCCAVAVCQAACSSGLDSLGLTWDLFSFCFQATVVWSQGSLWLWPASYSKTSLFFSFCIWKKFWKIIATVTRFLFFFLNKNQIRGYQCCSLTVEFWVWISAGSFNETFQDGLKEEQYYDWEMLKGQSTNFIVEFTCQRAKTVVYCILQLWRE